jgi:hypothetical protein
LYMLLLSPIHFYMLWYQVNTIHDTAPTSSQYINDKKICLRTTLRLVTLPHTHPIINGLNTAYRFCLKRTLICHYSKWSLDSHISITAKEKDTIKEEEQADER